MHAQEFKNPLFWNALCRAAMDRIGSFSSTMAVSMLKNITIMTFPPEGVVREAMHSITKQVGLVGRVVIMKVCIVLQSLSSMLQA